MMIPFREGVEIVICKSESLRSAVAEQNERTDTGHGDGQTAHPRIRHMCTCVYPYKWPVQADSAQPSTDKLFRLFN